MVLTSITYRVKGKSRSIKAKMCKSLLSKGSGLMFKKNSSPLFFVFKKEKTIAIHSFFCKPFTAIWLDKEKNATKVIDVKTWKAHLVGKGKYLLEIPHNPHKRTNLRRQKPSKNRKV